VNSGSKMLLRMSSGYSKDIAGRKEVLPFKIFNVVNHLIF
jgi:hypothetical protein